VRRQRCAAVLLSTLVHRCSSDIANACVLQLGTSWSARPKAVAHSWV
jgi:hypothetical protein